MDILKIVFLAVAGCMLAIQFKNQKSEYALYICFAVGIIIFTYSLDRLWIILEDLQLIELLSRENSGYLYFGAGGALGFDTLAAQTVLDLKKDYPQIKLILVLP